MNTTGCFGQCFQEGQKGSVFCKLRIINNGLSINICTTLTKSLEQLFLLRQLCLGDLDNTRSFNPLSILICRVLAKPFKLRYQNKETILLPFTVFLNKNLVCIGEEEDHGVVEMLRGLSTARDGEQGFRHGTNAVAPLCHQSSKIHDQNHLERSVREKF